MKGTTHTKKQNMIAHQLWFYRTEKGLSQDRLAKEMEALNIYCTPAVISQIEHNIRYVYDFELAGFCEILELTPNDLFDKVKY